MNNLTNHELNIINNYIDRHLLQNIDFHTFKIILQNVLPTWRSEQLCGMFHTNDNGHSQYLLFLNHNKQ